MSLAVEVLARHPTRPARVVRMTTSHGDVLTPTFMPVATKGSTSGLTPDQFRVAGTQILLGGNPYRMLVSPGLEFIQQVGGMHQLMRWSGPMLTDSGGFQLFSLAEVRGVAATIDNEGGHFRIAESGRTIHLTPAASLEAQQVIGADIVMAFDQCTSDAVDRQTAVGALERTHRWLGEGKALHDRRPVSAYGYPQAFFGIVQGARFRDLRERSADFVVQQDVDGVAIGGESIGFNMPMTTEILSWVVPMLPPDKPRYTMGVGLQPQNLVDAVAAGADMFDCVAPARNARHGSLYHGQIVRQGDWLRFASEFANGQLDLKKNRFARDNGPILDGCACATCRSFSRAYLHSLIKQADGSFSPYGAVHNLHVMHQVCAAMRNLICESASRVLPPGLERCAT
jgi:queuine tRNA-ribosyltransferase